MATVSYVYVTFLLVKASSMEDPEGFKRLCKKMRVIIS